MGMSATAKPRSAMRMSVIPDLTASVCVRAIILTVRVAAVLIDSHGGRPMPVENGSIVRTQHLTGLLARNSEKPSKPTNIRFGDAQNRPKTLQDPDTVSAASMHWC